MKGEMEFVIVTFDPDGNVGEHLAVGRDKQVIFGTVDKALLAFQRACRAVGPVGGFFWTETGSDFGEVRGGDVFYIMPYNKLNRYNPLKQKDSVKKTIFIEGGPNDLGLGERDGYIMKARALEE